MYMWHREVETMGTSYESAQVRCPFYRYDDKRRVACEGTEPESNLYLQFDRKEEKEKKMSEHCKDDFEACEIYKAILAKYQE